MKASTIGAQELSRHLSQAGVAHTLEVYHGDHGDHVAERVTNHLLPWMSRQLTAELAGAPANP